MVDKILTTSVVSTGGYDSSQNHLNLDTNFPGMATDLLNYEVGLNGGYRKINGYEPFDDVFATVTSVATPAEGKVLGVSIFNSNTGDRIIAARKVVGAATYRFYTYSVGTGWSAVGSPTRQMTVGSDSVIKVRYAQFNFGNVQYIIFVDGVNPAVVYNGTTWYTLTAAGTGGAGSPGGNQITEKPAAVAVFKNHIFLGFDSANPGIVCHSAPEDPLTWTAAAGGGQIVVGFRVNQIKPFRSSLYIFGKQDIKSVTVSGTDFVLNDVTSNLGNRATDSVVEIAGDLQFLGPDGIRPVSGTDKIGDIQLATISKQIQQYVRELTMSYDMRLVDSVVLRNKSQVRYFFHDPLNPEDTGVGIIGGLRANSSDTWEFSKLSGFRVSCATSDNYNDEELILHGDYSGVVHKQESGSTFDGRDILCVYSTPFLTFGDPKVKKMLRSISTYYRLEGSLEVNVGVTFDWDDPDVKSPTTDVQTTGTGISVYGDGSEYGDGSVYGFIATNPFIEIQKEGSFFSIKLTYSSSDSTKSHSILGFAIEYTPQARR